LQVLLCMALSSWMVPVTSLTRGHQVKSLLVFLVFTRYLDVRSGPTHHLDAHCYSFWVLCYHYQVKLSDALGSWLHATTGCIFCAPPQLCRASFVQVQLSEKHAFVSNIGFIFEHRWYIFGDVISVLCHLHPSMSPRHVCHLWIYTAGIP
jgi:hypothetical protein